MSQKLKCVNTIMKGIGRKDAMSAYAKFKFQLTSAVTKAFEWPDVAGVSEWTPDAPNDQFRCHFIEITPNNPELAKHVLHIEAATIGDFQVQKKAKKEGKNSRKAEKVVVDVICTVKFNGATSLAFLEQFKVSANKNSEMLIAYDPAPQQGEIDGTRVDVVTGDVHATKDQQQRVLEMPSSEGNKAEPTHAEKKAARQKEREKFAEIRERTKAK
jgi:hypothetical protein